MNVGKVIAIISPDSAPTKRRVQNGKKEGTVLDATQGRKTKSCIFMENNQLVLSALLPETILDRFNNSENRKEDRK